MKYTINLNYDNVEDLMFQVLNETRSDLLDDLGRSHNVFVWGDPEADDIEIQKHIDAIELLMKWYVIPDKLAEIGIVDAAPQTT